MLLVYTYATVAARAMKDSRLIPGVIALCTLSAIVGALGNSMLSDKKSEKVVQLEEQLQCSKTMAEKENQLSIARTERKADSQLKEDLAAMEEKLNSKTAELVEKDKELIIAITDLKAKKARVKEDLAARDEQLQRLNSKIEELNLILTEKDKQLYIQSTESRKEVEQLEREITEIRIAQRNEGVGVNIGTIAIIAMIVIIAMIAIIVTCMYLRPTCIIYIHNWMLPARHTRKIAALQ